MTSPKEIKYLSLIAASKGWARMSAPSEVQSAAEIWKKWVLGGKAAHQYQGRCMEVRYEQLVGNTEDILKSVFEFIGVPIGVAEIRSIVGEHQLAKMQKKQKKGETIYRAKNFFLKGKSGQGRNSMNPIQRYKFDRIAGDLLFELGYADDGWWVDHWFEKLTIPFTCLLSTRLARMRKAIQAKKSIFSFR